MTSSRDDVKNIARQLKVFIFCLAFAINNRLRVGRSPTTLHSHNKRLAASEPFEINYAKSSSGYEWSTKEV